MRALQSKTMFDMMCNQNRIFGEPFKGCCFQLRLQVAPTPPGLLSLSYQCKPRTAYRSQSSLAMPAPCCKIGRVSCFDICLLPAQPCTMQTAAVLYRTYIWYHICHKFHHAKAKASAPQNAPQSAQAHTMGDSLQNSAPSRICLFLRTP